MRDYVFRLFSFEGVMGRGEFSGVLLALAAPAIGLSRMAADSGASGTASAVVFLLLSWIFLATLAKRLKDAGRTRLWIFLPLALGLATFAMGFWFFQPPDLVTGAKAGGRAAATISIVPLILNGFAQVFSKAAYGLQAAALVWGLFSLALLVPDSKPRP